MSFKYYVLTSGSLESLSRQFETLKPNETVVVINTLNEEYVETATSFCVSNNIEYHITKSDGTPATGKNSVLELFLESDNEYMVHVDGDDMITPYGRNLYRTVALGDSPPDVLCLYNELCIKNFDRSVIDLFRKQVDSNTVSRDVMFIPQKYMPRWPHDYSKNYMGSSIPSEENLTQYFMKKFSHFLTEERATEWSKTSIGLRKFYTLYNDRNNSMNRMVFFSRKAAEQMSYDPILLVGEDQVQFYKLKKLAYEGKLDMRVRGERPQYSYLYLTDNKSTTRKDETDYDWQTDLMTELNKMRPDMYPVNYQLEGFRDPHYEVN